MNEERLKRLNSCNICKHKKRDSDYGTICSLTNKVADFGDICENYIFDKDEFVSLKKNIDETIKRENERNYKKKFDFIGNDDPQIYETTNLNEYFKYFPDEIIIKKTKFRQVLEYIFFISIIIGINYLTIFKPSENRIIGVTFGILLSVAFLYIAKIHLVKNTRKIIINSKGIEIIGEKTKNHKWKEILDINVLNTHRPTKGGSSSSRKLIIDMISSEIIEYPTHDLLNRRRTDTLLFWAKKYHEKYWKEMIIE